MKTYKLLITDEIFSSLIADFNEMLKKTILTMQSKESENGKINLELKISLNQKLSGFENKEKKVFVNPKFHHKVTSSIQIKDEVSGEIDGEYELISDNGNCYIRKDDSQYSLFDDVEK